MSKLKKLVNSLLELYHELELGNISLSLITLAVLVITIIIPTFLSGKYFEPDFWDNILGEANGMVLDLLIFGVFVTWLSNRSETNRKIQQYKNEIDDFRDWPEQTAAHRIRGNIRRLNGLGVYKIDLHKCYLASAKLADVNLNASEIWKADLRECDFEDAMLKYCDLWKTNLSNAILRKANLTEAKLSNVNLTGADLSDAILLGVDLSNANLQNANLYNAILDQADFTGAEGLVPTQLAKVKSVTNAKIDEKLLIQARKYNQNL